MALENFQEQISMYRAGDHSEFRRISLVYSFQDLVNTLNNSEDISNSVVASIESLTQLHLIDSALFTEISPDLLEPTIRLQILMAPKFPKALTQLSISLATYSRATDFQKELSNIMTLLNSEESIHPFEQFRNAQGPGSKDIFKTVVTFYIPIILRMLEDSEIFSGIENLMDFVEFMKSELDEYHAALGSELMPEIFQVLCERKAGLLKYAKGKTLVFMLELLRIYEKIKIFAAQKYELIEAIGEIFGDFSVILKVFNTVNGDFFDPLAVLAKKVIKGKHEKLALPYVFSGIWRLRLLIPTGIMCKYAKTRNKLISYCLFYCECDINPWTLTCCYQGLSAMRLFENLLKNIYTCPKNSLKQGKSFVRKLLMKLILRNRIQMIEKLIFKEKSEEQISFLVSILANTDEKIMYSSRIIEGLLALRPVADYVIVFSGLSKYLSKVNNKNPIKQFRFFQGVKELYCEIMGNLDTSQMKIGQILLELRQILD